MSINVYERVIGKGAYILYVPSEHTWEIVEDMENETDKAVSKGLEKMGLGSLRRMVAKGEYQGNMTKTKIEEIKGDVQRN